MKTNPEKEACKACRYWDSRALRYEKIYGGKGSGFERFFDYLFRGAFRKRLELTYRFLGDIEGKKLLDAGCGTGVFLAEAIKRGAARVAGVDFSHRMLCVADYYLSRAFPYNHKWWLKETDLGKFIPEDIYDYVLVIGVLEYLDYPQELLGALGKATRKYLIASFSRRYSFYNILRLICLRIKGLTIRLSTLKTIESLVKNAGFETIKVRQVGPSFLVMMKPSKGSAGG